MATEPRNTRPVVPFSNGSDAMYWQETNCWHCPRQATCSMARAIDEGAMWNGITKRVAARIAGVDKWADDTAFPARCAEFGTAPPVVVPRPVADIPNQLALFAPT